MNELRRIELNRWRVLPALGLVFIVVLSFVFPFLLGSCIIAAGLLIAAMVYDIGTAIGMNRNFIADAEKRGMRGYAERLRIKKL